MRLDISEIQEAIKNHDAWVQDAAAMRTDIDNIHVAIRDHEGWMAKVSKALRQMQAKDQTLENDIASLRSASARSQDSVLQLSGDRCGQDGSDEEEDAEDYEAAISRIDATLTQQLSCGFKLLRTVVSAVQSGLVRQIEIERGARRAALTELRSQVTSHSKDMSPGRTDWQLSKIDEVRFESAIANLRESVHVLEEQSADWASETERGFADLRREMAAVRAEQQMQAVASGSLALTSAGLSHRARQRTLKALEKRQQESTLQGLQGLDRTSPVRARQPGGTGQACPGGADGGGSPQQQQLRPEAAGGLPGLRSA